LRLINKAVVAVALEQPAGGQVRVAQALKRQGLSISPASCALCLAAPDLETEPASTAAGVLFPWLISAEMKVHDAICYHPVGFVDEIHRT
jgi:hypothetical protein